MKQLWAPRKSRWNRINWKIINLKLISFRGEATNKNSSVNGCGESLVVLSLTWASVLVHSELISSSLELSSCWQSVISTIALNVFTRTWLNLRNFAPHFHSRWVRGKYSSKDNSTEQQKYFAEPGENVRWLSRRQTHSETVLCALTRTLQTRHKFLSSRSLHFRRNESQWHRRNLEPHLTAARLTQLKTLRNCNSLRQWTFRMKKSLRAFRSPTVDRKIITFN